MNRDKIQALISKASSLLRDSGLASDDVRSRYLRSELERLEELTLQSWPLSQDDKASVHIGLFAVRELEGTDDALADVLEELDYELKRS